MFKLVFCWRIETKIAGSGSGSISQRQGSADPDPDPRQNVMDPQHCWKQTYDNHKKGSPRTILEADAGALKRLQEVTSINSSITEWLFVLCMLLTKTSMLEVKPGELFLFRKEDVLSRVEAVLF